jgi:thiol-disulfide isomerase/thioredoxin
MIKSGFISLLLALSICRVNAQEFTNYSYKFRIKGLKDTVCYLGFHFGDKQYIKDTARINSKGFVEFAGKDTIKGGIYLFILPNKKWFEFILNEPAFTLETDTVEFVKSMQITGSLENTLWFDYMRFVGARHKRIEELRAMKGSEESGEPVNDAAAAELEKISQEIISYRLKLMADNPKSFVAAIFKAMKDVEIPDPPVLENGKIDSAFRYYYFREHYFDNFDFGDSKILRTPLFEPKLKTFLEKILPQIADTIIYEVDKLIEKARKDPEVFKVVVHTVTYTFERSQIMCLDAVFVHMVEKYYKTGQCDWISGETYDKMVERSDKLKPLLCNKKFPNVILQTPDLQWKSLYKIPNDYVVVYFWDATCSHCKKATPKLHEMYESYFKPHGIEVFAVEGELETENWLKFIREHQLNKWINVSDNPEIHNNPGKYLHITDLPSLNFRSTFDLGTYPVIYVIDKDRKIIGKRLGVEQLEDFFDRLLKLPKESGH